MQDETVSPILLAQRFRNGIMDCFEIASSFGEIAELGAFQTINVWDDWHVPDIICEPIFTVEEQAAIQHFASVLGRAADATDDDIFDFDGLASQQCWHDVTDAAKACRQLFERRGRFDQHVAQFSDAPA